MNTNTGSDVHIVRPYPATSAESMTAIALSAGRSDAFLRISFSADSDDELGSMLQELKTACPVSENN